MQVLGFTLARTKALNLAPVSSGFGGGGWFTLVREPYTGAWQRNDELSTETVLAYYAVYSCLRLISTDIGKLALRLVKLDRHGVWVETESPAFSPVLRKPNRYQTIHKFVEQWILSKLIHGNAIVLKQRDLRQAVTALYVLDATRVVPLVAPDGSVYYQVKRDDLAELTREEVIIPASEIIHDTMITPFHPLIGVSPLFASALAARQGLSIQSNSSAFFQNRSTPNGILTAPVGITKEQADATKAAWAAMTPGEIAVIAGDVKYQPLSLTAVDSQLIEQLKTTAENVCSTFGVPPYLVDIGPPPPYANFEPLLLKYHSQCIQSLTTNFEACLDEGLGLIEKKDGTQYGTEFDIDDLIWMDTATRVTSAQTAMGSGGMSPDEARRKYFGLGPVDGGDTPYMQNQMWPLKQLAERETPAAPALPTMPVVTDTQPEPAADLAASFRAALQQKALEHGLAA